MLARLATLLGLALVLLTYGEFLTHAHLCGRRMRVKR